MAVRTRAEVIPSDVLSPSRSHWIVSHGGLEFADPGESCLAEGFPHFELLWKQLQRRMHGPEEIGEMPAPCGFGALERSPRKQVKHGPEEGEAGRGDEDLIPGFGEQLHFVAAGNRIGMVQNHQLRRVQDFATPIQNPPRELGLFVMHVE